MKNVIYINSGEFGYEVLACQGYLRRIKKEENFDNFYVCSYPGRSLLYRDFADKFIPMPKSVASKINPTTNRSDGFPEFDNLVAYLKAEKIIDDTFEIRSSHQSNLIDYKLDETGEQADYIDFEPSEEAKRKVKELLGDKKYVVVFPRSHKSHVPYRCYEEKRWVRFLDGILEDDPDIHLVICGFGMLKDYQGDRIVNLTEWFANPIVCSDENNLDYQVEILKNAVAAIYDCSGAVFFGALCKTPVFFFCGKNWLEPDGSNRWFTFTKGILGAINKKLSFVFPKDADVNSLPETELLTHFLEFKTTQNLY